MRQGIDRIARQSGVSYINADLTIGSVKGGVDLAFSLALEKTGYFHSGIGVYLSVADNRYSTSNGFMDNFEHTITGLHAGAGVNVGLVSGSFDDFAGEVRSYTADAGPLGLATFAPTQYRSFEEVASAAKNSAPGAGFELGILGSGLGASKSEVTTLPLFVLRFPNSPGFEDFGWIQTPSERFEK